MGQEASQTHARQLGKDRLFDIWYKDNIVASFDWHHGGRSDLVPISSSTIGVHHLKEVSTQLADKPCHVESAQLDEWKMD